MKYRLGEVLVWTDPMHVNWGKTQANIVRLVNKRMPGASLNDKMKVGKGIERRARNLIDEFGAHRVYIARTQLIEKLLQEPPEKEQPNAVQG